MSYFAMFFKKNVYFILLTSLIALLQNLAFAEVNSYHLNNIKTRNLETNFLWLTLNEYEFSHPKGQILVSTDIPQAMIYAADRGLGEISLISINKSPKGTFNLTKLNTIKIPNSNKNLENVFILDIKFSDNKLYSSVFRYSDKKNSCAYIDLLESNSELASFKSIFKSSPCLSRPSDLDNISGRVAVNNSHIFIAGGNMLMDIGNNSFPRDFSEFCCPENNYLDTMKKTNFFGSVVSINKKTYVYKQVSKGHRVPEGLFFDSSRNILWESEHGPRGGDEVNKLNINKLQDYGYPFVTLGAAYIKNSSNLNTKFNSHKKFTLPFLAFVPSVGPSQFTLPPKNEQINKYWDNDLLLTTLKDRSIYRIKMSGGSLIYLEKIYIGNRLRSVDTLASTIVMGTDNGSILVLAPNQIEPKGTFPINDYDWPLCALKGKDESCNAYKK